MLRRAAQDRSLDIIRTDVTQAYFYADACRDVYVKLPAEDQAAGEEHLCGKLNKAMYGSRDATQNWQNRCSEVAKEMGFSVRRVSRCHFYHKSSGICGMVHGDDFVFVGRRQFLKNLAKHMGESIGLSDRFGLSKTRDTAELWIQDALERQAFEVVKVDGARNSADSLAIPGCAVPADRRPQEARPEGGGGTHSSVAQRHAA